jgi:hypothetical protein
MDYTNKSILRLSQNLDTSNGVGQAQTLLIDSKVQDTIQHVLLKRLWNLNSLEQMHGLSLTIQHIFSK